MPAKELILEPKLPPKEVRRLEVTQPWISSNGNAQHYKLLADSWEMPGNFIDGPCLARDKATGKMIFHLLRGGLERGDYELPWNNLRSPGCK
jgi:hypothetical protein